MARSHMKTIGNAAAAEICAVSPWTLRYRAERGKIRAWRWSPLRFRLVDVLEARERMQVKDPRGRKPGSPDGSNLSRLMAEVLS